MILNDFAEDKESAEFMLDWFLNQGEMPPDSVIDMYNGVLEEQGNLIASGELPCGEESGSRWSAEA